MENGRALPGVPVDRRTQAVRHDARDVSGDAASRDVRERVRAGAQTAHVLEVEARGCEQVLAAIVVLLEDAPDEREPVRVHTRRREADDRLAGFDARAVDELLALDHADARSREVELVLAIDPGQLGRLAA